MVLFMTIGMLLSIGILLVGSHKEKTDSAHPPVPVAVVNPPGFVRMAIPDDNPLTEEGIALGRRLFYDPILSADSSLSCNSCHLQKYAFAEPGAVSIGVDGRTGRRSAPSLVNVGYYNTGLFWDGRAATLEEQALHPVSNPDEMGADWEAVEQRLRQDAVYRELFQKAFGIEASEIDRERVGKALAQFQRTLISANAKFDRVQLGLDTFTAAERRGWEIFFDFPGGLPMAECGHCHADPLFTNQEYFNNGLDPAPPRLMEFKDEGRGGVTGRRSDLGKFRTPSLRNIELTAPYMHDGRFRTLEEVIDHYASGGHYAENVSPNVRPLRLTAGDKADLIAFLRTLTDTSFVNNPKFENPYR